MALVVLRTFLGFLVQVVPCAVLCILPFRDRFAISRRRVYQVTAAAILLAEVPFCLTTFAPFWADNREIRFFMQDLVFITLVGLLIALYFRYVDAPTPQKLFVALLALNLGFFATLMGENVGVLLGLPGVANYRYPTPLLISATLINGILLATMTPLVRMLGRTFITLPDAHLWKRMCVLPGCFFAVMFVFHQMPLNLVSTWTLYCIQSTAIMAFAVFMFWWIIAIAREVNASTAMRERLATALERSKKARGELEIELADMRARVAELEQEVAKDQTAQLDSAPELGRETPELGPWAQKAIAVVGSRKAVSFMAGELVWAESNNRARILHFTDGSSAALDTTLSEIYSMLPEGHFAYCHRSVVVNLHRVVDHNASELSLDDGSRHPMSRRRYPDFCVALSDAGCAQPGGHAAQTKVLVAKRRHS